MILLFVNSLSFNEKRVKIPKNTHHLCAKITPFIPRFTTGDLINYILLKQHTRIHDQTKKHTSKI